MRFNTRIRRAFLAIGLCALNLTAVAGGLRTLTHEDVWLLRRIGTPVVSPDGRLVVVSVTEPAYDSKEQSSDLWLLRPGTTEPARRLTFTKGTESGVSFSADSSRIAFTARREGDTEEQVYVLDLAHGGEALRVTDVATGARHPRFSPDGNDIAYVSDVWPGARDEADNRRLHREQAERKSIVRIYDSFPVRSWDHWLDGRRPHLYVQSLRGGAPRDLLAGTALAASAGFTGRSEDDGTTLEPVWTPDGRGLVFSAGTDSDRSVRSVTSIGLWYVARDGGEPRRLTPAPDSYEGARFAGAENTLYAEHTVENGHLSVARRIAAMRFHDGVADPARDLTAALDRSVSAWGVTTRGELYFLAGEGAHAPLHVARPGEPAHELLPQTVGLYSGLAVPALSAAPLLVARYEAAHVAPELVTIDPATRAVRPLSAFNAGRLDGIDLAPVEEFSFVAHNGRRVHSLLVRPPHFDPTAHYPLFVVIHGGPHSSWQDSFGLRWNYHLLAAGGYVLVLTDYAGSTGHGDAFAQAIERDPLAGPADEINEAADEAIHRYPFIDASRQCAGGASYGGHLANWLEGTTTRYRCLISHAGLVDLTEQWGTSDSAYHREVMIGSPPWANDPLWATQSPISHAAAFHTPMLLSVGERDFRVPLNNTLEMWTALQRQQVPGRLLVFPEANHWILKGEDSRLWYREVAAWLDHYLHPAATP